MKLALLNDFESYAGAETSIKQRLKAKPDDLEVDFITPDMEIDYGKYDGFILENIVKFKPDVLKILVDKPFIKVEHDFNFCLYRNQIHCKQCDEPCPVLYNPLIKEIYTKALLVICASPAHMELQKQLLADWDIKYTYGLPWTYASTQIPKVKRNPKSVAFLGTIKKYKGVYDIINLAQRKQDYIFDIAGRHGGLKGKLPDNVNYLGEVENKWDYLASHEYFIHIPRHLDPCPGTIIEAILAGCKIIFNPNVGTLSYPFHTKKQWEEALKHSGAVFWKRATETFNKHKND